MPVSFGESKGKEYQTLHVSIFPENSQPVLILIAVQSGTHCH